MPQSRVLHLVRKALFTLLFSLPQWTLAQVTPLELHELFEAFQSAYGAELGRGNQFIVFNRKIGDFDWLDLKLVHASYVKNKIAVPAVTLHEITITGDMLKIKGFDQDAAAIVLCHELGHGIGGAPYKDIPDEEGELASTEGQSDYYAARHCLPKIWKALPQKPKSIVHIPVAQKKCGVRYAKNPEQKQHCLRTFAAMRGFQKLRLARSENVSVSFEAQDKSEVSILDLTSHYYPSAQCRLDTLMAGALQQPRPACWYPRNHDRQGIESP